MRSVEEIRQAVHVRAGELRHRQVCRQLLLSGGACGVLSVTLLTLIGTFGDLWHRPLAQNYTGTSLLGDSAGGYVIVAVAAFMLGVVITVILKRQQQNKTTREQDRDARKDQGIGGIFLNDEEIMNAAGGKNLSHNEKRSEDEKGGIKK